MNILLISASLRPGSHSRAMARVAERELQAAGVTTSWVDLRDYPLPLCDGDAAYDDPNVEKLNGIIAGADVILVAVPIYTYYVNAAVKNLVELTGSVWENKTVGFLCAAGGRSSYMSVMAFANNLMLDFRCLILPRFVYAVKSDFGKNALGEPQVSNGEVLERIRGLTADARRLGRLAEISPG